MEHVLPEEKLLEDKAPPKIFITESVKKEISAEEFRSLLMDSCLLPKYHVGDVVIWDRNPTAAKTETGVVIGIMWIKAPWSWYYTLAYRSDTVRVENAAPQDQLTLHTRAPDREE